ncbi:unnamed protein product [Caenorhabditis auriculariae]|uniref:Xanthine dehydrogenase n=1 Tax=Caenorhabditis auriculariae TaxID=2777116 RepID=A0A8S1H8F7_9PELO|nr:unnamed protein product [Caenorhabditis auriculariae]
MDDYQKSIHFNVNGKDIIETNVDSEISLAYYLRNKLGLRGTKLGCEEGVCGSCTVVLGKWNKEEKRARYTSVNACLVPLFQMNGHFILTVEGIGGKEKVHPIQERLVKGHAVQCGFCTPGFVMSAYALLRNNPNPRNRCRCTGYRPILEALYSFSEESGCCGGNKSGGGCCRSQQTTEEDEEKLLTFEDFPKYDSTQEIIFPPSLLVRKEASPIILKGQNVDVFLPINTKSAENFYLDKIKDSKIPVKILGSGLVTRLTSSRGFDKEIWISPNQWKELNKIETTEKEVFIGAACSIQELLDALHKYCDSSFTKPIQHLFDSYSSPQTSNFATWSGAIVNALKKKSSLSDVLTLFVALNWKILISFFDGESPSKLTVLEYSKLIDEEKPSYIIGVEIERKDNRKVFTFKQGEAGACDSTVVNTVAVLENDSKLTCFIGITGGLPVGIPELQDAYEKKPSVEQLIETALSNEKIKKFIENSEKGAFKYRLTVAALHRLYNYFFSEKTENVQTEKFNYLQYFKSVKGTNQPGLAATNVVADDTPLFAEGEVHSVGQIVAVIAAEDLLTARKAAKLVKINYKKLSAVINLQEAIKTNSYVSKEQIYGKSSEEVEAEMSKCSKILEGTCHGNGQEHFYLETQAALILPGEGDEMLVYTSSQSCAVVQNEIGSALKIPANKIVVKTKRLGGAFGGKLTNAAAIAVIGAVVGHDLKRPVSCTLSRRDDLVSTGKRHGFYSKYRIGINDEGRVQSVDLNNYVNCGWSVDHSDGVVMVMTSRMDAVYDFGIARAIGHPMKTNTCSNTAFRGYGHPQGWLVAEGMMRRIAREVGKDVEEVKELNFNHEGRKTFAGATIRNDAMLLCWTECRSMSDFDNRKRGVAELNRTSKNVKKGISMSAVRYPLPQAGVMAQGIATVQIFLDGSIGLSIGGIDMGQGLYQKCVQVASRALGRPVESITVQDTSTDKTANAVETGGSQGADVNGLAVIACCEKLLTNLKPSLEKANGHWEKAVLAAYKKCVPLQVTEYGLTDLEKYGIPHGEAPYNTSGAAAVEVELDCITGLQKLVRVDIVVDLGESLNPAIDIGQIEGAFMQGYGWMTCENVEFDEKTGVLIQNTAKKYKIPTADMVPPDFRIKLIGANKNFEKQVYSSKGVGEPPLLLCVAVNTAILNAIEDFRKQNGQESFIESFSPLNTENIFKLCYALVVMSVNCDFVKLLTRTDMPQLLSRHDYFHYPPPATLTTTTDAYKPVPYFDIRAVEWALIFGVATVLGVGMGANDIASSFGTSVGSHTVTLTQALILATIFEMMGALIAGFLGNMVKTLEVIDATMYQDHPEELILGQVATLIGCAIWLMIATIYKIPVSAIHATLGGNIGFSFVLRGFEGISWWRVLETVIVWIFAPFVSGLCTIFVFYVIDFTVLRRKDPKKAAFNMLPAFYCVTFFSNIFLLLTDGSRIAGFNDLSTEYITAISLIFGGVAGLGCMIIAEPVMHYRIKHCLGALAWLRTSQSTDDQTAVRLFSFLQLTVACFSALAYGADDIV